MKKYFIRETPHNSVRIYIEARFPKSNYYTFLTLVSLWQDDVIKVEKGLNWHGFELMEDTLEPITQILEKVYGFTESDDIDTIV